MRTVEKKYYVCELCGKVSTNEEKIKFCQDTHCIINEECDMEVNYKKGQKPPNDMVIKFPDGTKAGYILSFYDDEEVKK